MPKGGLSSTKTKNKSIKIFKEMVELAIKYPEITPDKLVVISGTKENIEKILTGYRMNLIHMIKNSNPKTIGALSKMTGRPIESVSRDLRILNSYDIVKFEKHGREKKPIIEKDAIIIPLS
jgi:predicted transcriptional regulator